MPATDQQQPSGVASTPGDKDSSRVVHALVNEVAKLGFLCWLIAWALSSTSAADSYHCETLLSFDSNITVSDILCRHQQVFLVEPATSRDIASNCLLASESTE